MKRMIIVAVVMSLLLAMFPVGLALAATTADVTVTATPSFIGITNSPGTYDFGQISAGATENTTNGYFTITNGSSVAMDISIKCNGWSGTTSWTYGSSAENTGQLAASSANGGAGGSSGAGDFDKTVLNGSDTLLCDAVGTSTNPTWELQLQAPSSFTHGDEQTTTVTVTATAN
jgi:hypothetical protein